ncbi:hypothetical protein [Saccharothrix syringae]|uniref:Uncharacterized protein n=1 Tax=Saccharothrix syringae TaxID=103733 RepID=A0A5Q0GU96_SACSY|nr:hypothetical protein [Saccharothrix syringae]QFZ16942.1 hypothetical protein EKG83_05190 [Saccharothrix syringae]
MIADPAELPDLRLRMREHIMTPACGHELVRRLAAGKSAVIPRLNGPPEVRRAGAVTGALLMARREARRLGEAQLYWVDRDMTALTLAAADRPSREPVMARRMPAEAGLMVFAESVGGQGGEPAMAVSWSRWTPQHLDLDDGSGLITWRSNTAGGEVPLHPEFDGVWLTYWSPRLTPLGESVLPFGQPSVPLRSVFGKRWEHVVYTAWQLMKQSSGAKLVGIEELPRSRHGRKRDQRAGVEDGGTVRLVRVHARRQDAAPGERDAPRWNSRWPVRPYRRNTCLNPGIHAEGGCEHEERIVPAHIKGPADKPLKVTTRVHVWDTTPPVEP